MDTTQNAVMVFQNPEFGKIRTSVDEKGEPLFCLVDLCRALELENPTMVKARLREDGLNSIEVIDAIGRKQIATFVNERNMYRCILQSRKSDAVRFQDWICDVVLISIRKTGGYGYQPPKSNIERIKDGYIALLEENVSLAEKNAKLVKRLEAINAEKRLLQAKLDRREERKQLQLEAPKYFTQFLEQTDLFNESNKRVPFDVIWAAFKMFYLGLGLESTPTARSFGLYLTQHSGLGKGRSTNGIFYYKH